MAVPLQRRHPTVLLIGIGGALGILAAGCGGSGTTKVVTHTVTTNRVVHRRVFRTLRPRRVVIHRTVVVHPAPVAYQLFEGSYFSMEYPTTWVRDTSEASKGGYLDTTIHSDENSDVLTRVDVTPNTSADAAASVNEMEQVLSSQPGYQQIRLTSTTFQGYSGVVWEFVVSEHGVSLHKVDVVLDDGYGDGIAVLTQAPAAEYRRWQPVFAHIRQSLLIT
jgi:hypothetical protein